MYHFLENYYKAHPWMERLYKESVIGKIYLFLKAIKDFFKFKSRALIEYIRTIPRSLGKVDDRFLPLKQMKGKYAGKRCFIVCTGPSLTIEDLELLKNEYVFGMNSTSMIIDKTSWRPDFYGIQDSAVFERLKDAIVRPENGRVFAPLAFKNRYNTPDEWVYFPTCSSYNLFECYRLKKYFARFSSDSYLRVYNGFSISYSLVQIAYYLGFDEIYLLGADCSYSTSGKNHFAEHGHVPDNFDISTLRLITIYGYLKKYSEKYGFKVYNATRGGMLEVFDRVKLENILAHQEKNKIRN